MANKIRNFRWRSYLILPAMIFALSLLLGGASGAKVVKAQSAPSVAVMQNATVGSYLTDGAGKTLYVFSADTAGAGTSACNDSCAGPWPPFLSSGGNVTAPSGASGTFATFARQDGSQQVSYNGMPLYYFTRDANPGDVNGQNVTAFGGTWTVATP
jgi:predicted lipoprotein with Yx(FWY)xxD motif